MRNVIIPGTTMDFRELAKGIVCNIIAVALSMTASAVNGLLPFRPDWTERVEELAAHFRSVAAGEHAELDADGFPGGAEAQISTGPIPVSEMTQQQLLQAYNHLWQFTQNLQSDGLGLDDQFCERVEAEWTVTTLLSYLRNADRALQDHASKAVESAGMIMQSGISDPSDHAGGRRA